MREALGNCCKLYKTGWGSHKTLSESKIYLEEDALDLHRTVFLVCSASGRSIALGLGCER